MSELTNLQPADVFYYFNQICKIPHGSGNTKAISDYCADFAESHGLRYEQDQANNIIIYKEGTVGYENSDPVILQGHLDMVCAQDGSCTIDMETEGVQPVTDGVVVRAQGTTLGGDDGVAVAYILAILASDTIPHPPLEAVLTTDEEIGLLGAASLDVSQLQGHTMINIDNESEGSFLVSCAGGIRVDCITPLKHMVDMAVRYDISITGLSGGHSGMEISKWGANSNILAGRLLYVLDNQAEFWIADMTGGTKDNAIPVETNLTLYVTRQDCGALEETIRTVEAELQKEYSVTDPDLRITWKQGPEEISRMLDAHSTGLITFLLMNYPNGIQRMSSHIPGLVETSLNLGILYLTDDEFHCGFSIRSSVSSAKEALVDKLIFLTEFTGGTCSFSGDYPAWEYQENSPLRDLCGKVYRDLYQKDCRMEAIHAGVECGIFASRIPGLDCISYGPDLFDVHTTREHMDIASVGRVWEFTLELLKQLK